MGHRPKGASACDTLVDRVSKDTRRERTPPSDFCNHHRGGCGRVGIYLLSHVVDPAADPTRWFCLGNGADSWQGSDRRLPQAGHIGRWCCWKTRPWSAALSRTPEKTRLGGC